ncbi:MAG: methyltransferase family protein [Anaerolineae bacterium]
MRGVSIEADRLKSYGFVAVQGLALGLFALTGPVIALDPVFLVLEVMGGALGVWAIWAMRLGNFGVTPDITVGGRFVSRGPYNYIRHPMYASLLLMTLALLLSHFSPFRLAVWAILLLDLWLKLSFEETKLVAHFEEYASYRQRTTRLVPFLF